MQFEWSRVSLNLIGRGSQGKEMNDSVSQVYTVGVVFDGDTGWRSNDHWRYYHGKSVVTVRVLCFVEQSLRQTLSEVSQRIIHLVVHKYYVRGMCTGQYSDAGVGESDGAESQSIWFVSGSEMIRLLMIHEWRSTTKPMLGGVKTLTCYMSAQW